MSTNTEPAAVAEIFASPAALRDAFEKKLIELLEQDVLGVFILVLANASFQHSTFERLRQPLATAFARWCARFDAGDDRVTAAPADDVEVFRQLRRLGFERLEVTRWRRLGPWEVQFNQLRALRPPRMSHAVVSRLDKPFDPGDFHFNRSFLRKEVFWEGELAGAPLCLLYNKFPFAERHCLLVPDPSACKPQSLTQGDHALVWEIALQLGRRVPGLGFGYNAYGAYASVNHLHVQMFVRSAGHYAIESPRWRHNAGNEPYPLPATLCTDSQSAWLAIEQLHAKRHAYNLLYRPGCMYLVERAIQGSYAHSDWTGGFAWSELAGAITTFDVGDFERLTEEDIDAEFRRLAVTP
jgi:diadenosine tetraphosphate (Ap4A) HIT family hydrolase